MKRTQGHPGPFGEALRLAESTTDAAWTATSPLFPGGTIGRHVRHLLEFAEALLCGLADGCVDYSARPRDLDVETRREVAVLRLRFAEARLAHLRDLPDRDLTVIAEDEGAGLAPDVARSTIRRELAFVESHATHHLALVAALLRVAAESVPAGLGVAASTLRARREALATASLVGLPGA